MKCQQAILPFIAIDYKNSKNYFLDICLPKITSIGLKKQRLIILVFRAGAANALKRNWPNVLGTLLIQKWNKNQSPHYENKSISTGNINFRLSLLVIFSSFPLLLLSYASISRLDWNLFCSPNELIQHLPRRHYFSCIQTRLWGHIKPWDNGNDILCKVWLLLFMTELRNILELESHITIHEEMFR